MATLNYEGNIEYFLTNERAEVDVKVCRTCSQRPVHSESESGQCSTCTLDGWIEEFRREYDVEAGKEVEKWLLVVEREAGRG